MPECILQRGDRLATLPTELVVLIASFLDTVSVAKLVRTSKKYHGILQYELSKTSSSHPLFFDVARLDITSLSRRLESISAATLGAPWRSEWRCDALGRELALGRSQSTITKMANLGISPRRPPDNRPVAGMTALVYAAAVGTVDVLALILDAYSRNAMAPRVIRPAAVCRCLNGVSPTLVDIALHHGNAITFVYLIHLGMLVTPSRAIPVGVDSLGQYDTLHRLILCSDPHGVASGVVAATLASFEGVRRGLHSTDNTGATPLYRAISETQFPTAHILLDAGADAASCWRGVARPAQSALGTLLLRLAGTPGRPGEQVQVPDDEVDDMVALVARLCVAVPGAVRERGRTGETPLHLALRISHDCVMSTLLRHGADPLRVNSRGKTALQVAVLGRESSGAHPTQATPAISTVAFDLLAHATAGAYFTSTLLTRAPPVFSNCILDVSTYRWKSGREDKASSSAPFAEYCTGYCEVQFRRQSGRFVHAADQLTFYRRVPGIGARLRLVHLWIGGGIDNRPGGPQSEGSSVVTSISFSGTRQQEIALAKETITEDRRYSLALSSRDHDGSSRVVVVTLRSEQDQAFLVHCILQAGVPYVVCRAG